MLLSVSRKKTPKITPCEAFVSCVLNEIFIAEPEYQEYFPALENW